MTSDNRNELTLGGRASRSVGNELKKGVALIIVFLKKKLLRSNC